MMNLRTVVVAVGIGLCLAAVVSAQRVHLYAYVVEDADGFAVECTDVRLDSTTVDLSEYVGKDVRLDGDWNGDPLAPHVDVTAIEEVRRRFELAGNGKLGGDLEFRVEGTPGDFLVLYWSIAPGFVNVGEDGAFLLDPTFFFVLTRARIPDSGEFRLEAEIPDDDIYLDLPLHSQAALVHEAGGASWTNADCVILDR